MRKENGEAYGQRGEGEGKKKRQIHIPRNIPSRVGSADIVVTPVVFLLLRLLKGLVCKGRTGLVSSSEINRRYILPRNSGIIIPPLARLCK